MNPLPISEGMPPGGFADLLLPTAVNSLLLLAPLGLAIAVLGRRSSGATNHFAWLAALLSLLLLPVASHVFLPVKRPAWAGPENPVTNWVMFLTYSAQTNETPFLAAPPMPSIGASRHSPPTPSHGRAAEVRAESAGWLPGQLPMVWTVGFLVLVASQIIQRCRRWRLGQRAKPVTNAGMLEMLAAEQSALGLKRPVRLLCAPGEVMPMTWGSRHPVILLPEVAARWDAPQLQLVLRHELAHIQRWDCLAQTAATLICALFWFNPLAWLAARRMRAERERACDETVLRTGARPSTYAGCLLEIARRFSHSPQPSAIALARPSQLERRVRAILAPAPLPRPLNALRAALILAVFGGTTLFFFGPQANALDANPAKVRLANVRNFVETKQKQARELAKKLGYELDPEMQKFLDAGAKGDWELFTNTHASIRRRIENPRPNDQETAQMEILRGPCWPMATECLGFYEQAHTLDPKYLELFGQEVISAIPASSVYFGGTDPGRFIITAMSKSHANADPFFTLTQNALADGTYLAYLRHTYGERLQIPTSEDSQRCFANYLKDAQERLQKKQLRPGEDVRIIENRVQVSGQVAVMAINALLAKTIFDQNPRKEFYIEESFPLDWMYPHLEPHGLIFKLNRQPLAELTPEILQRDREYWQKQCDTLIGPWLREGMTMKQLADFAWKTHGQMDLKEFKGDPGFPANEAACKTFGKLRSSIAGLYAWRQTNKPDKRLTVEAEYAFQQAFALCPYSPEAVFRYVNLLLANGRQDDARLIADTAHRIAIQRKDAGATQYETLARQLKEMTKGNER